jgi:hypothetical protein
MTHRQQRQPLLSILNILRQLYTLNLLQQQRVLLVKLYQRLHVRLLLCDLGVLIYHCLLIHLGGNSVLDVVISAVLDPHRH